MIKGGLNPNQSDSYHQRSLLQAGIIDCTIFMLIWFAAELIQPSRLIQRHQTGSIFAWIPITQAFIWGINQMFVCSGNKFQLSWKLSFFHYFYSSILSKILYGLFKLDMHNLLWEFHQICGFQIRYTIHEWKCLCLFAEFDICIFCWYVGIAKIIKN